MNTSFLPSTQRAAVSALGHYMPGKCSAMEPAPQPKIYASRGQHHFPSCSARNYIHKTSLASFIGQVLARESPQISQGCNLVTASMKLSRVCPQCHLAPELQSLFPLLSGTFPDGRILSLSQGRLNGTGHTHCDGQSRRV